MDLSISSGAPPAPSAGAARPAAPGTVRGVLPHLVWEGLLLVIVAAVGIALAAKQSGVFTRGGLWGQLVVAGMFASALALSLRTATPNLAVTTIGMASGWWYVYLVNHDAASVVAWLVALLGSLAIGLVLAVLVGVTPLPGWAVSLVATGIIAGVIRMGSVNTQVLRDGSTGNGTFVAWMVVFALGSIAGGVALAVPGIRAATSRNRLEPGADPPRIGGKLVGALVGLGGSSLLAGVAGILFAQRLRAAQPYEFGLQFVVVAVLLGGVSVLGRRAGILGVVLGVALVAFVQTWLNLDGVDAGTQGVILGVLGLVGLGVNALLEGLGRWADRPKAAPVLASSAPPGTAWGQPFPPGAAQPAFGAPGPG